MPTLAHFSDLHITAGPRLEDQRQCLTSCVDAMLAERPDAILFTGDLYGKAVPYKPTPAERAVWEPQLVRMAQAAPVVIVQGNHDDRETMLRLADLAGVWPIHVVTGAEVIDLHTPSGPLSVFGLAYPTAAWLLAGEDVRGLKAAQTAVQQKLGTLMQLWRMRIARGRQQDPTRAHVAAMHLQIGGSLTSGGEVLAGQEIELSRHDVASLGADYVALGHIHKRQEVAVNAWYPGSLWRNSFAERDAKGWHLIEINDGATSVRLMPSPCRDFVTLDWRWAADSDSGEPRWVERPDSLDACAGAEVRCRLIVPDTFASSVPWAEELERVRAAGAHRVVPERAIEPTVRARAPELVEAPDDAAKLGVYWSTLSSPPIEVEQGAALEVLAELLQHDDEAIKQGSDELQEVAP